MTGATYYPRKTGAVHTMANDVWEGWQTGLSTYDQRTIDGRCVVRANYGRSTYQASVDGAPVLSDRTNVAKRFQTRTAAAEAALKVRDAL